MHSSHQIISILNKKIEARHSEDVEILVPLIKTVKFFKEQNIKDNDLTDIAACLQYEYFKPHRIVFEHGSIGDKFYIILSGTVGVYVPYKRKKMEEMSSLQQNQASDKLTNASQKNNQDTIQQYLEQNQVMLRRATQRIVTSKFDSFRNKKNLKKINDEDEKTSNFHDLKDHPHLLLQRQFQSERGRNKLFQQFEEGTSRGSSRGSGASQKGRQKKQAIIHEEEDIADFEDEQTFQEVAQINSGGFFGEHALINDKPRAAKIRCLTECHFAVISKHDFNKSLSKIMNKARLKNIEFFHDLPFFRSWSNTQLSKLILSFTITKLKKGQVLFREGEPNDDIYFVKSGEIQATKLIIRKDQTGQEPVRQFLRGEKTNRSIRTQFNPYIQSLTQATAITNVTKNKETINIFFLGKGQLFGEERLIVQQEVSPYTATCHSYEAEVFRISSIEFHRKIQSIKETARLVTRQCFDKLTKIKHLLEQGIEWNFRMNVKSQGNSPAAQKLSAKAINPILLQSKYELRDTLKEIVKGFPGVSKVASLLEEEIDQGQIDKLEDMNKSRSQFYKDDESMYCKSLKNVRIEDQQTGEEDHKPKLLKAPTQFAQKLLINNIIKQGISKITTTKPSQYRLSGSQAPSPRDDGDNITPDQSIMNMTTTTKKLLPERGAKNISYVSSNLLDAIQEIKSQQNLASQKRQQAYDRLQQINRSKIVDETSFAVEDDNYDDDSYVQDDPHNKLYSSFMSDTNQNWNQPIPRQPQVFSSERKGFLSRATSRKSIKSGITNILQQYEVQSTKNSSHCFPTANSIRKLSNFQDFASTSNTFFSPHHSKRHSSEFMRMSYDKTAYMKVAETLKRGLVLDVYKQKKRQTLPKLDCTMIQ